MPSIYKAVFKDSVTYTAADGTDPPAIIVGPTSAIDITKCLWQISSRDDDDPITPRARRHFFQATLAVNGSNVELRLSRNQATFALPVTIEWVVTEFNPAALAQDIQSGTLNRTTAVSDIAINTVDPLHSMIVTSFKTSIDNYYFADTGLSYTVELTTNAEAGDQLTITSNGTPGTDECDLAYQIVEFNPAFVTSEHGTSAFTTSGTQAITAVTLADSVVLLTGIRGGNGSGARAWCRVKMNSNVQLGFNTQNYGSGVESVASWTVLSFHDGSVVRKGEVVIGDGNTTPTQPSFPDMDAARAQVLTAFSITNGYFTSTSADGNNRSAQVSQKVNATGDGQDLERVGTVEDFEVGWAAIEWALDGGGGGSNVPIIQQHMKRRRAA